MKAAFSSHERPLLFNFGFLNNSNLADPNDIGIVKRIQPPDIVMSPMSPSGRRTSGFQLSIHTFTNGNATDPRDGNPLNWTAPGNAGYSITIWRFDNIIQRWAQFQQLTGLAVDEIAVTSDIDASELFFEFDPTKLADDTGGVLMSFLEL